MTGREQEDIEILELECNVVLWEAGRLGMVEKASSPAELLLHHPQKTVVNKSTDQAAKRQAAPSTSDTKDLQGGAHADVGEMGVRDSGAQQANPHLVRILPHRRDGRTSLRRSSGVLARSVRFRIKFSGYASNATS